MINIKRVYDTPDNEDGYRILVDMLWPRGLSKGKVKVDLWLREIASSHEFKEMVCSYKISGCRLYDGEHVQVVHITLWPHEELKKYTT